MSRFRRLSALSLIYEQLEKCEEPELIWEAAVMDNTLDDISSLKFLQAIGLKLDKSLSGSKIDDRETSIKVMQKIMREGRAKNSVRCTSIDHAAKVATELGLSIDTLGHIKRLHEAIWYGCVICICICFCICICINIMLV